MTPHELAKLLEAENSPTLHLVRSSRPYKIPKGYMRWEAISGIVAFCIDIWQRKRECPDKASYLNAARTALWYVQDAPIYLISKELLRAFESTDIEDNLSALLADISPPLPTFILLFPENAIVTHEGGVLNYAIVHLSDLTKPEFSSGESDGIRVPALPHYQVRNLHWSGVDSREVAWFSGFGIDADGSLIQEANQLGSVEANSQDKAFMFRISKICMQALIALCYTPDLFSDSEEVAKSYPPRSKHRVATSTADRYPRWLGKNFAPKKESAHAGGTHASPRIHWRRGHYRRVPVGKREEGERKWVWIEPVLVGV